MIKGETYTVHIGNNLDILPMLEDNSIDSIVTDPPYELGFMGKKWDSSGIAYNIDLWKECLRILKPGGHLLSFGGTRTWHRVAVAIEDAGFEIRDSIAWMYGSGFPKSLDISKAIDKAAGAEREVIGSWKPTGKARLVGGKNPNGIYQDYETATTLKDSVDITAPSTPEAKQWEGWGTALKPAFEPIVVARKPLIGTVAANVLEHGTGGLNIDGSRIGTETVGWQGAGRSGESVTAGASQGGEQGGYNYGNGEPRPVQGRWPANVILDPYTAELLDEQSGISKSPSKSYSGGSFVSPITYAQDEYTRGMIRTVRQAHGDSGGASRFFYVAKASKRDRNEGLEGLPYGERGLPYQGMQNMDGGRDRLRQNFHPTVKPTDLMRYLIKLVTPPGGTVLDPFTGSGSTGKAAILEGFEFVGVELTEDYIPIIEGRLKHAEETASQTEEGLF